MLAMFHATKCLLINTSKQISCGFFNNVCVHNDSHDDSDLEPILYTRSLSAIYKQTAANRFYYYYKRSSFKRWVNPLYTLISIDLIVFAELLLLHSQYVVVVLEYACNLNFVNNNGGSLYVCKTPRDTCRFYGKQHATNLHIFLAKKHQTRKRFKQFQDSLHDFRFGTHMCSLLLLLLCFIYA